MGLSAPVAPGEAGSSPLLDFFLLGGRSGFPAPEGTGIRESFPAEQGGGGARDFFVEVGGVGLVGGEVASPA